MVMEESDIEINLTCDLPTLRVMYKSLCETYERWPGGHPDEQIMLEKMKNSLYVVLYSTLMENGLI